MNVVQQAYNSDAIFGLIACEMGVTIHSSCAGDYLREGLVIREIANLNETILTQAIWKENSASQVTKVFAEFLDTWKL